MNETKICLYCGKEFKPNNGKQLYCSKKCYRDRYRGKENKELAKDNPFNLSFSEKKLKFMVATQFLKENVKARLRSKKVNLDLNKLRGAWDMIQSLNVAVLEANK